MLQISQCVDLADCSQYMQGTEAYSCICRLETERELQVH